MEPRNLLKPDFETSVTFEPLGFFLCGFHCCAQENELYHFMYVSLSTLGSPSNNNNNVVCGLVCCNQNILSMNVGKWI